MRMVKVNMPVTYIDWAELFRKFTLTGHESVELTDLGDRNIKSVYESGKRALVSHHFDKVIRIIMRRGHLYIVIKEDVDGA